MKQIIKYPRTPHLRGSALQTGDNPDQISMETLKGKGNVVIEEKVDGANAGISFDPDDRSLVLQSRGHSLDGGGRERQFNILKKWGRTFERDLRDALSTRYVLYAEWLAAKHSVAYDNLPSFLLTYDLWDRERNIFLSTPARAAVLDGLPIAPVHVVHEGWVSDRDIPKLVRPSVYKTPEWRTNLTKAAQAAGQDPAKVMAETDMTDFSEGIYGKLERGDATIGRFKFVRAGFLQTILDSGTHWASRPIIPNMLAPGADMFAHRRMLQAGP